MRPPPGYLWHKVQFRRRGSSFCVTAGIKGPFFLLPFLLDIMRFLAVGRKGKRNRHSGFPLYSAVFSFFLVPLCGKWDSDLFPICVCVHRYREEDQINAPREGGKEFCKRERDPFPSLILLPISTLAVMILGFTHFVIKKSSRPQHTASHIARRLINKPHFARRGFPLFSLSLSRQLGQTFLRLPSSFPLKRKKRP